MIDDLFSLTRTLFITEKKAAKKAGKKIENANALLLKFVVIGWGIYPLGYLIGTADGQWYSFMADLVSTDARDLIYNVGDAINKIGTAVDIIPTPRPAIILVADPVSDCSTIEVTGFVPVPV